MALDKNTINRKHLLLGLLLNILVVIVFLLIYHAYVIGPKLKTGVPQMVPMEIEANLPK